MTYKTCDECGGPDARWQEWAESNLCLSCAWKSKVVKWSARYAQGILQRKIAEGRFPDETPDFYRHMMDETEEI